MSSQTRFGLKLSGVLALVLVALYVACTPSEVQTIDTVLGDASKACALEEIAGAVIPPGTPAGLVAGDVALGCGLATADIPKVESWVASLERSQAEAGTAPDAGTVYRPGPRALVALRARAVSLGIVDAGGGQ